MRTEPTLTRRVLAVFCGGFCGTIVRYLLSLLIQGYLGTDWPYDILLINITGAFFLALSTTLADATILMRPMRRLLINVGFLGAYTTFSSLALGDTLLFANGKWFLALLYLFLSASGGVFAIYLGSQASMWYIHSIKTKAFEQAQSDLSPSTEHIDVQNDILRPDDEDPKKQAQK